MERTNCAGSSPHFWQILLIGIAALISPVSAFAESAASSQVLASDSLFTSSVISCIIGFGAALLLGLWVTILRYQIRHIRAKLSSEYKTRLRTERHLANFAKTQHWITNFSNVGIWVYDFDSGQLEINGIMSDTLSLKTMALRIQLEEILIALREQDRQAMKLYFEEKLKDNNHICECLASHNSQNRVLLFRGRQDTSEDHQPRAVGIMLDVTTIQSIERQLRQRERSMEVLVANIPGAVFRLQANASLDVAFISAGIQHIIGAETLPESGINEAPSLKSIVHPADWLHVRDTLQKAAETSSAFSFSHRVMDESGEIRWVLTQGQGMWDHDTHEGWLEGVIFDETDQILNAQRLDYLAHRDPLTGLANRYTFHQRSEQAISAASRNQHQMAFILMDFDNFKAINDSLGHPVGDEVLQQLSTRLADTLRNEETLCRIGGDEFVVVVPQVYGSKQLVPLLRRLMEALSSPIQLSSGPLSLTTSIGVAVFPQDGLQVADLLKSADTALYRSKTVGKNTYTFFTEEMGKQTEHRFWLERELRRALDEDQLSLVYQPQFEIESQRLHGIEVLVRWHHAEAGFISPGDFIPVAESSGLILPLGSWVQEHAFAQMQTWLQQGFTPGKLSVNVSVHEMGDPNFHVQVIERMKRFELKPEHVMLEVTESIFVDDNPCLKSQLDALADYGINLAIDDFGKGYSSLSYIKKLRASLLKIDQHFVQELGHSAEGDALVVAMISMAKALGLDVLAEGCEEQYTLEKLREMECDLVQGYLFAKPMKALELQERFLSHSQAVNG
ncbi:putative bifunctional diguanylate cyclase/phosphodiesterase [Pokkaliibacter sp. CJK22405]|uniref:putative bifunctional diguanylate cyclase/phosphodiesterase n=1 Tax=Pokkaliibacter sp. CJK22405 TaxID=3384615 RepID=UPI003985317E